MTDICLSWARTSRLWLNILVSNCVSWTSSAHSRDRNIYCRFASFVVVEALTTLSKPSCARNYHTRVRMQVTPCLRFRGWRRNEAIQSIVLLLSFAALAQCERCTLPSWGSRMAGSPVRARPTSSTSRRRCLLRRAMFLRLRQSSSLRHKKLAVGDSTVCSQPCVECHCLVSSAAPADVHELLSSRHSLDRTG